MRGRRVCKKPIPVVSMLDAKAHSANSPGLGSFPWPIQRNWRMYQMISSTPALSMALMPVGKSAPTVARIAL